MKRWMTFGLTIALSALLSVSFAQHDHDHEGDIHLGLMDGAAAVIEPEELAMPPYRIRYTLTELLPGAVRRRCRLGFPHRRGRRPPATAARDGSTGLYLAALGGHHRGSG
jgi:hypothetical protein